MCVENLDTIDAKVLEVRENGRHCTGIPEVREVGRRSGVGSDMKWECLSERL